MGILDGLEVNDKVLLTGAGFTKDFGGFLASEMWSFIFNHPEQKSETLRNLLKSDFDYESIYWKVLNGDYLEDEKNAIKAAMKYAYDLLDASIRGYGAGNRSADSGKLTDFLSRFKDGNLRKGRKGFIFTLNQDMFIERYVRNHAVDLNLISLGVNTPPISYNAALEADSYIKLPEQKKLKADSGQLLTNDIKDNNFFYVKLHGSYNWKSHDGKDAMVIGMDKEGQIVKEPLLNYYSDLFREVLLRDNMKLFTIGYGFRDRHINDVIWDSIHERKLKLYVLHPLPPDKFRDYLLKLSVKFWGAVRGYYPYRLSDVFPPGGGESPAYRIIKHSFFKH